MNRKNEQKAVGNLVHFCGIVKYTYTRVICYKSRPWFWLTVIRNMSGTAKSVQRMKLSCI